MKPEPHHHFIDKLALISGVVSGVALFPQVVATLLTGDTRGLSALSFVIIFINSWVWLTYAIHRHLVPLAVTSLLTIIASGILVILIAAR